MAGHPDLGGLGIQEDNLNQETQTPKGVWSSRPEGSGHPGVITQPGNPSGKVQNRHQVAALDLQDPPAAPHTSKPDEGLLMYGAGSGQRVRNLTAC